jgi:hypothetical protein
MVAGATLALLVSARVAPATPKAAEDDPAVQAAREAHRRNLRDIAERQVRGWTARRGSRVLGFCGVVCAKPFMRSKCA